MSQQELLKKISRSFSSTPSGGSEKQFTDALRVYEVQYGKLDIDYLKQWAKKLNLESLWRRLVDEAETV